MRRDIVDNLLVSCYIINAIMPICDYSGIIPGAGFSCRTFSGFAKVTLGFKWILSNYVLGHPFLSKFFSLFVCFVKLSDPAAFKLNNNNKNGLKN